MLNFDVSFADVLAVVFIALLTCVAIYMPLYSRKLVRKRKDALEMTKILDEKQRKLNEFESALNEQKRRLDERAAVMDYWDDIQMQRSEELECLKAEIYDALERGKADRERRESELWYKEAELICRERELDKRELDTICTKQGF